MYGSGAYPRPPTAKFCARSMEARATLPTTAPIPRRTGRHVNSGKVEILFAHLKRIVELDRLRLRGRCGARVEFPPRRHSPESMQARQAHPWPAGDPRYPSQGTDRPPAKSVDDNFVRRPPSGFQRWVMVGGSSRRPIGSVLPIGGKTEHGYFRRPGCLDGGDTRVCRELNSAVVHEITMPSRSASIAAALIRPVSGSGLNTPP
jgi:hypothetical protein